MDIQAITRQSLGVSDIIRAQTGAGRITVPVQGNHVYANFKHITGVGGGQTGPVFSVSRLRALDNLIDRLQMIKGDSIKDVKADQLGDGQLTKMLKEYNEQLYNELKKNNPYRSGINASGIALDIFA
ncbi:MAG: hypothetical protein PQJ46_15935 [Spirochaetales bacterium]|nr:hypothetical protein [Spirochaetales bacterium]